MGRFDIHNYKLKEKQGFSRLEKSNLSPADIQSIQNFLRYLFHQGIGMPRRCKVLEVLLLFSKNYLKADLQNATKDQLKDAMFTIESLDVSVWTKQSYKTIVRQYYTWLEYGDEYSVKHKDPDFRFPDRVRWIRPNFSEKDRPKVKAGEILSKCEVDKIINTADRARDKAFLSMLYELGARVGEIGNLSISDVSKAKNGFIVDINGKTGKRTPLLFMYSVHVANWLNAHPFKDDPKAALWVTLDKNLKPLNYSALRKMVIDIVKKSGIKKRVYNHLFRHTRVTHLLLDREINEAQAKVYFGWSPDSKMLNTYAHLLSKDVNATLLKSHGIIVGEDEDSKVKPVQCKSCEFVNPPNSRFCAKCATVLDLKTAILIDEEKRTAEEKIAQLFKDPEVMQLIKRKLAEGYA